jgi:hypothetical protein
MTSRSPFSLLQKENSVSTASCNHYLLTEAVPIKIEAKMPPLALHHDQLNDPNAVGIFVEIPFVDTRKHIHTGTSVDDEDASIESKSESEIDLDDLSASSTLSEPSLISNLLGFDPCASCTATFASCSYNSVSDSNIPEVQAIKIEGRTRGAAAAATDTKSTLIPEDVDNRNVNGLQEKIDIDIVIDDEARIKCSLFEQWRTDHARAFKSVMIELLMQFDVSEEDHGALKVNKKESERLKELILECVDRERNRKSKGIGKKSLKAARRGMKRVQGFVSDCVDRERDRKWKELGGKRLASIKRATKRNVSSLRESKFNPFVSKHLTGPEEPEEGEECSEQSRDIQTIYSSPNSIHYRFDRGSEVYETSSANENEKKISRIIKHSKELDSKIKRRKNIVEECSYDEDDYTKVRAVAVLWT